MMKELTIWARQKQKEVDWNLFFFLLLFLNVKLVVKLAGIAFIYLRRFDFRFRFSIRLPGIPLFYPVMILIALLNMIIGGSFSNHDYLLLVFTGVFFWGACIIVFHQLSLTVQQNAPASIHRALWLFFVLNAAVSFIDLSLIILEIKEWNPYRYQGLYQKYFIGTGDYIKGITFDNSTTNAVLNAFGLVYFLFRRNILMSLVCMTVLLLTCSNFTNLVLVCCLIFLLLFKSTREQKSIIVVHLALMVAFLANVSPQNNQYAINIAEKFFSQSPNKKILRDPVPVTQLPDSLLNPEQVKQKFARLYLDSLEKERYSAGSVVLKELGLPKVNIHAPEYQHRPDSSKARLQAISFLKRIENKTAVKIDSSITVLRTNKPSGKLVAFQQLGNFLKEHPAKSVLGNGMGNFSSKIAFRATGLQAAGGYPEKYIYIHDDFMRNHLSVYLDYFVRDSGYHSIANSPNSVYGQLLGEYGVMGLAAFFGLYIGCFFRKPMKLTYGLPVLLIMLCVFMSDYWFEQLSVIPVFELLLLLNRKETREGNGYA